jgi:hypothetical protein
MGWQTSTSEEPCPCGTGVVVITTNESDNMYSGDDHSMEVKCPSCAKLPNHTRHRRHVLTWTNPATGLPEEHEYPKPLRVGG